MNRIACLVLIAGALIACKGKDDTSASTSAAPAPTAPAGASAPKTAAPTPPPATATVDVCSFVTKEQVEAVLGKLTGDPKPEEAQGSLLGGCSYDGKDGLALVQARPANEFDGTVKYSAKDGGATDVPGLGEKASNTKSAGLLVKLAGKPYFLGIMVMSSGGKADPDKSIALAKVVVPAAK